MKNAQLWELPVLGVELIEWDKLFDDNFEVVKKNDRNLLILSGLFINSGPYRLNN